MRERPYKSLLPLPSSTIASSGSCVAFPYQEVVSPSLTIASPRWRVLRRERIFFQWRASIMRKRKKYIYFITKVPPVILRSPKNTNKLLSKCCIWVLLEQWFYLNTKVENKCQTTKFEPEPPYFVFKYKKLCLNSVSKHNIPLVLVRLSFNFMGFNFLNYQCK